MSLKVVVTRQWSIPVGLIAEELRMDGILTPTDLQLTKLAVAWIDDHQAHDHETAVIR